MLREAPSPKTFGILECPSGRDDLHGPVIGVSGWALSSESPIIKITALVNGKETTDLSHGLERDDVVNMYPNFPDSGACGYTGFVHLQDESGSRIKILVRAELENGKLITVGSKNIRRKKSSKTRFRFNVFFLDVYIYARTSGCRNWTPVAKRQV